MTMRICFYFICLAVAGIWVSIATLAITDHTARAAFQESDDREDDDHDHDEEDDHADHDHDGDDHNGDDHNGDDHNGDDHNDDDHNDDDHNDDDHDHDEGDHEDSVKLNQAQQQNAGIELAIAEPRTLHRHIVLNGMIGPNQERLIHVGPRFPGMIRRSAKSIGEMVAVDELLFTVESNQSLTLYEIRAPMAGTVIEKEAVLGEFVDTGSRLMVIADLSTVWVDFRIPQRDVGRLSVGQSVTVKSVNDMPLGSGTLSYLAPFSMADTQTILARAVIDNAEGRLRPGLFVKGEIALEAFEALVSVTQTAIQYWEGSPVVFVAEDDVFAARPVELGANDGDWVEVRAGLRPGETYVSANSFILKAELGKELAAHDH